MPLLAHWNLSATNRQLDLVREARLLFSSSCLLPVSDIPPSPVLAILLEWKERQPISDIEPAFFPLYLAPKACAVSDTRIVGMGGGCGRGGVGGRVGVSRGAAKLKKKEKQRGAMGTTRG